MAVLREQLDAPILKFELKLSHFKPALTQKLVLQSVDYQAISSQKFDPKF